MTTEEDRERVELRQRVLAHGLLPAGIQYSGGIGALTAFSGAGMISTCAVELDGCYFYPERFAAVAVVLLVGGTGSIFGFRFAIRLQSVLFLIQFGICCWGLLNVHGRPSSAAHAAVSALLPVLGLATLRSEGFRNIASWWQELRRWFVLQYRFTRANKGASRTP